MTVVPAFDRRDAVDAAAVAIMIFLTFSWGLNGVAQKLSNVGFNPVFGSLFRAALGALLVYLWCVARGIPLFKRDGTLPAGLLAGFLFGAEFLCIFVAFDYTSLGRGSLMVNTMPFWVLIGAHFLLGERMSVMKVAGVALAFSGVVVIFSDRLGSPGPDAWIGDLLTLLGGILWAATTLVIKKSRLCDGRRGKTAALSTGGVRCHERAIALRGRPDLCARFRRLAFRHCCSRVFSSLRSPISSGSG